MLPLSSVRKKRRTLHVEILEHRNATRDRLTQCHELGSWLRRVPRRVVQSRRGGWLCLPELIGVLGWEAGGEVRARGGARHRPVVAMLRRRPFGPERQHDMRTMTSKEQDDLANQPLWIDLLQRAVGMPGSGEGCDPQYLRRRRELGSSQPRELGTGRNGDAGALSGIPVRCAE